MVQKLTVVICSVLFAFAAIAQEAAPSKSKAMVDRGLVVSKGTGEVGLDLSVGLDKGAMGKRFQVASEYEGERYPGISFKYGVIDNLEVGLATVLGFGSDYAAKFPWFGAFSSGFNWGGAKIYGKYAFLPFLGAELGILLPGEKFGDNRLSLDIGIPFKYTIMPGLLSAHVRPDLILGFAKKDTLGGGKAVQVKMFVDYGVTVNATESLYFDLSSGFGQTFSPDLSGADRRIPLAITAGYTVIPALDVYLNFVFDNLAPKVGGAMDQKGIGLGARFRF